MLRTACTSKKLVLTALLLELAARVSPAAASPNDHGSSRPSSPSQDSGNDRGHDDDDDQGDDDGERNECWDSGQPRVKHVFVITLENKNYADTFGASTQDPYLTATLRPMGLLLSQYYATGHVSLDNYISMISGQASSLQTQADCIDYNDFAMT